MPIPQQTHPILFLGRRHTISAPTMAKEIAKIGVRLKYCCVKRIFGGRWAWATLPKFVPAPHRAIVATASVHPSQTLTRAERERACSVIGHLPGLAGPGKLNRARSEPRFQSRRYSANSRSRVRA